MLRKNINIEIIKPFINNTKNIEYNNYNNNKKWIKETSNIDNINYDEFKLSKFNLIRLNIKNILENYILYDLIKKNVIDYQYYILILLFIIFIIFFIFHLYKND
jgi:hypothetical protein